MSIEADSAESAQELRATCSESIDLLVTDYHIAGTHRSATGSFTSLVQTESWSLAHQWWGHTGASSDVHWISCETIFTEPTDTSCVKSIGILSDFSI